MCVCMCARARVCVYVCVCVCVCARARARARALARYNNVTAAFVLTLLLVRVLTDCNVVFIGIFLLCDSLICTPCRMVCQAYVRV